MTVYEATQSLLIHVLASGASDSAGEIKAAVIGAVALLAATALPLLRSSRKTPDEREMGRLRRIDADYHKTLIRQVTDANLALASCTAQLNSARDATHLATTRNDMLEGALRRVGIDPDSITAEYPPWTPRTPV